jgi:RNA polymerase sigma-70 factor (ECF subfamily)
MPSAKQADSRAASDPAEWVDRHGDALFRYAMLRLNDPHVAEEIVQECFVAALGARERFAGQSSERTWLIGILKRKLVDHIRRITRESSSQDADSLQSSEPAEETFFDKTGHWKSTPARWGGDPRGQMENREFWEVFQKCLGALPSSMAATFLLREVDQADSPEICEAMGLSPTNLWTRLHRARLALRECLEKHWFGRRRRRKRGGKP